MGLDMYLNKKTYVKNWDYMKPEDRHKVIVLRDGEPVSYIKPERVKYIEEEVGYWRKANAIHNWFVEHVQDGNDDCGNYYVSEKQLQELLDAVNKVLGSLNLIDGMVTHGYTTQDAEPGQMIPILKAGKVVDNFEIAEENLPTTAGFFFGSTDYDQWYVEDLQQTKKIIETILAEDNSNAEFYYHSSW